MKWIISVANFLKAYYSISPKKKSLEQIEREKYLYKKIPFSRYMIIPCAFAVQLCCGSLYSWSVFNIPIEHELNLTEGKTSITFYIAVGIFGFSAAASGPCLEMYGPCRTLLASCLFIISGLLISALSIYLKCIALLYVGYGVLCGMGFGIAYLTPIAPLQKWFPSKKGMLSGIAVCGFGGGSMASAQLAAYLITKIGVSMSFVVLTAIILLIMIPSSFILRTPPGPSEARSKNECLKDIKSVLKGSAETTDLVDEENIEVKLEENTCQINKFIQYIESKTINMEFIEALKTREFIFMYLTLLANSCFGILIISKLQDIAIQQFGVSYELATHTVSVNSFFNLLGGLVYGALSDIIGQRPLLITSLGSQIVIAAVTPYLLQKEGFWAFMVLMWALSSFYGGGFGIMPAFLNEMFGSKNLDALHGVILTSWSLVGVVGGIVFSLIYKMEVDKGTPVKHRYDINLYWICCLTSFGLIGCLFIRTNQRDRLMPPIVGQLARLRIHNNLLRLQWVSKKKDDIEWEEYCKCMLEKIKLGQLEVCNS
ncbi:hypothetical protein Zmor_008773 [Zophobas morio]|jgi:MFS family permease|uniref:Major facilitator superfamily (MFS) profile domain-containing protein n=1 Tax=Zophobas morio TaxID=2755281 RepID=A0AA38LZ97_9CUCU|nr:hypothetical protein Zmor_008773 [Zophobas morio]